VHKKTLLIIKAVAFALFSGTEESSDFDIGIPNYGSGKISFLCA